MSGVGNAGLSSVEREKGWSTSLCSRMADP